MPWVALRHPLAARLVGATISSFVRSRDSVLLYGSVGVGKSEVARGFVRHCLGDQRVSVSSPTFMIAQEYDTLRGNLIHHIDLYRLSSSDEIPVDLAAGWSYVDPIGALFTNRSQSQLFPNRVEITLTCIGKDSKPLEDDQESDDFDEIGHHQAHIHYFGAEYLQSYECDKILRLISECQSVKELRSIHLPAPRI